MKKHCLVGLAVVFGIAAAGCSGVSTTNGGTGKQLNVRIGADISILDPAKIFQIENQTVAANIYDGLVQYDQKTNKLIPDLATKWSTSPDGLRYTFDLRTGVVWQKNYGNVTAQDVKFSIDRVRDPKTGSPYAGQYADIESVETPSDNQVVIQLRKPNSGFLNKVAAFNQGWIVSKAAVEKLGDKYNLDPIGTGPFQFDHWTPGSEVTLVANPTYFGTKPSVQQVNLKIIKDENAAAAALSNKEIDILFALQSPTAIKQLKQVSDVEVLSRVASSTVNLVLNQTIPPLNDLKVRQAIAYGINRDSLVNDFFQGTKTQATSPMTSTFPEFTDDVTKYPYDPVKARDLIKQAGASGAKITLTTVALHPYDQIVVPIADDLKKIGLDPTTQVLERAAYQQARASGNIDTSITSVVGPPDADSLLTTLLSSSSFPPGLNTARYSGIDGELVQARLAQTQQQRDAAIKTALQKVMTDVPVIPLYADELFIAKRSAVQGLVQNSLFTIQFGTVSVQN